jgi:hypothetical protein
MSNPWLKKNPFMSMWLSGANAVGGTLSSRAKGQVKRQAASAMTQASNDVVRAWTAALTGSAVKPRKGRR